MKQDTKNVPVGQIALICFGGNENSIFGNPQETIQKSMILVSRLSCGSAKTSALYATPAYPPGAGPDFVNAAMAIVTELEPASLLAELHRIEAEAGRQRTRRWGQRTLDLDLIAVGDLVCPDAEFQRRWRELPAASQQLETPDQLILPHPRVQDRGFALMPLADVAPDWRHPLLGLTIREMLQARPQEERDSIVRLN